MKRALALACGLGIAFSGVMATNASAADTPGCQPDYPDNCSWQPGFFPTSISTRGTVESHFSPSDPVGSIPGILEYFAYSSGTATGQGLTVAQGPVEPAPMFTFVKTVPTDARSVGMGYQTAGATIDTDALRSFPDWDEAESIVLRISEPSGCAGDWPNTYSLSPQGFFVNCAFATGEPRRVSFSILFTKASLPLGAIEPMAGFLNLEKASVGWNR